MLLLHLMEVHQVLQSRTSSGITSTGGGGGNPGLGRCSNPTGSGGGSGDSPRGGRTGGTGNTPPVSPPQGNSGGGSGVSEIATFTQLVEEELDLEDQEMLLSCNPAGTGGSAGSDVTANSMDQVMVLR
jgi:hypothetical protein